MQNNTKVRHRQYSFLIEMTTARKFCRFSKVSIHADTPVFGMTEVPDGGLCLSPFLVITETKSPRRVLMGHLDPNAPWDHIGALDQKRVEMFHKGWMLPSSHLMLHESPEDSAIRILREQLEIEGLTISEPRVFSDLREHHLAKVGQVQHWDIGFIFRSELPRENLPRPKAWAELKLVDLANIRQEEIARSHEDVLEHTSLLGAFLN